MHNSHMEFPHQAVKHWQHLQPAASAAGPSHQGFWLFSHLGVFQRGSFPFLTPSCPVCLPIPRLPAVALGAGCFIGHCGERWDSSGLPAAAFCPRARSLSGQWQEAPASPSAGAGAARGRCSARAALFGADKLRKPGRRMEGSVRKLGPGAEHRVPTARPQGDDPGKRLAAPGARDELPVVWMGWMRGRMQGWLGASAAFRDGWNAKAPELW